MVFVITGTAESDGNTVGRLLADDLGWEFVEAEGLTPSANLDRRRCSASPANTDPAPRIETLAAAINSWIYEWRDVVVSCPMLTERDRRQLSEMSSLVKIVRLEISHGTGRTPLLDRSVRIARSESFDGWRATCQPEQEVLTVDSSRQVEEVIAEIVCALVLKRRSPLAVSN
jgi:gluconate kinase